VPLLTPNSACSSVSFGSLSPGCSRRSAIQRLISSTTRSPRLVARMVGTAISTIYYNKYEKSIWFLRRRNPSTFRLESCSHALAHSDNRPRQPSKFSLLRTCIRLQPSSQNEREFKHLKLPGRARYDAKRDGDQSLGANRKHSDGDESCFVRR